jgi:hypothetical protein
MKPAGAVAAACWRKRMNPQLPVTPEGAKANHLSTFNYQLITPLKARAAIASEKEAAELRAARL